MGLHAVAQCEAEGKGTRMTHNFKVEKKNTAPSTTVLCELILSVWATGLWANICKPLHNGAIAMIDGIYVIDGDFLIYHF